VKLSNSYYCSQCTSLLNLENQWGETAMHLAAAAGHARVLEKLLDAGAQLNPEDKVVDLFKN
jgi:ankyrin repeat protein